MSKKRMLFWLEDIKSLAYKENRIVVILFTHRQFNDSIILKYKRVDKALM